ncbi:TolC family protein [Adhaeretor mobilis]|uniref:Outer membrane efflux protein n=1 Tax=Adhaeretor mobilis TaxID=1930276 RepID=A0A517MZN9_9BACT|nr:TolC family protein [Adhaeretor mobilis]QDT00350.1 Outer membrane efflux protein [Adhaeretor mobilis]
MKRYYPLPLLLLLFAATGCQPSKYRQRADADANCLTAQKANVLGSLPDDFHIKIDPRSRMFDPYDPDCEPMPPDDPLSHLYMECVDCKKGSKCWRCLPETPFVENPEWLTFIPRNERGALQLDSREAVSTALLHSPRYQSELEELFLSALDVSFERFRFDTQFYGGSDVFFTADGRDRSGTADSSSLLAVSPSRPGNSFRAERLTATGGQLVVGMANSLVWQFAGPDDYSSNSFLDFSLVQPLLRGAGRTRVLERLTISERALLANVRSMERYRRGFYLSILTGADAGQGASRRGGFFGGSGLEGFSGVGGGGFGNVGNFSGFGGNGGNGGGGGFTGGAGAQGAGGFLGLLQSAQQISNQRANVAALRESYDQLQASYDAGRIDRFQVELAQQALYNAQSQLLTSETVYQSSLDFFKISLGLPPDLPVEIKDPLLDQFQLVDPNLEAVQSEVSELLAELRVLRAELADSNEQEGGGDTDAEPLLVDLDWGEEISHLRDKVEQHLGIIENDFTKFEASLPARKKALASLELRNDAREANIDPALFDIQRLEARAKKRQAEFLRAQRQLAEIWKSLEQVSAEGSEPQQLRLTVEGLTKLSSTLLELSLVQAGTRLEGIAFEPSEITPEQALQIASAYRRDWQNARAQLVDTWRLIYFNANDLKSDFGLVFNGDIGNVGDNPFRLRDTRGRLRVGLQFDPPITRLAERNIYRQSLIEYQQARRSYYQFRDGIAVGLRGTIRQLRLNEVNFELRRAAVLVAISQVDLTQLRLSEPPKPEVEAQFGATTARDLVQSLSDLLNVQNDFLSVWVNYEVQRLNLEHDLGLMELDPSGLRIEQQIPYRALLAELCVPTDPPALPGEADLELPESIVPPAEQLPKPIEELKLEQPDTLDRANWVQPAGYWEPASTERLRSLPPVVGEE